MKSNLGDTLLRRRPIAEYLTRSASAGETNNRKVVNSATLHHNRYHHKQSDNYPPPPPPPPTATTMTAASTTITTAAQAITSTTTPTPTTTTTTTLTNRSALAKRSLSESSVDDYQHKSSQCQSAAVNGKARPVCKGNMWRSELSLKRNGSAAVQPHSMASHSPDARKRYVSNLVDVAIRVILVIVFAKLEVTEAFRRKIYLEELWLYKNPRTPDIVSPAVLLISVILCPFLVTLAHRLLTGDRRDYVAASWAWTLTLGLNGLCTSLLKIFVGRPRPDFYYRCFPDGIMVLNNFTDATNNGDFELFNCTGNAHVINEGLKSFPSGHSSFAFTSFGFVALYLAAKLHTFSPQGRGQTWRLFVSLSPLLVAFLVAVSRYCDYHHHWQDILVGSVIGLCVSYFVYRQYYPSIFARYCHRPYTRVGGAYVEARHSNSYARHAAATDNDDDDNLDVCASATDTLTAKQGDGTCAGAYANAADDERSPLISDDKPNNKWI